MTAAVGQGGAGVKPRDDAGSDLTTIEQVTWNQAQADPGALPGAGSGGDSAHFVFDDVSVRFAGGTLAIKDVTLEIARREFIAILGPSGCGKSTLLNLASGLLRPSRGRVLKDGVEVAAPNANVGYVTQKDHLLPWRTIASNVGLPLEFRGVPRSKRAARVQDVINQVGLTGFEKHYPKQLSGGMVKRAALARTMVYEPEAYLMDEPFASLDAQLRTMMHDEFLGLWATLGATVVFVTHDLAEAITLADRIVVMTRRPGRVKLVHTVKLPRPRDVIKLRESAEYAEEYGRVWHVLGEEFAGTEQHERGR